jgi:C4-dicarboxylate-specific signal transduction histidine kinase
MQPGNISDPMLTVKMKAGTGLELHIVLNLVKQQLIGSVTGDIEKEKGVSYRMKIPFQPNIISVK